MAALLVEADNAMFGHVLSSFVESDNDMFGHVLSSLWKLIILCLDMCF